MASPEFDLRRRPAYGALSMTLEGVLATARRNLRSWKFYLLLGVLALASLVPAIVSSPYYLGILIMTLLYVTLGTSWNLLGGYGGQASLGHAAFFGVGAYTTAILAKTSEGLIWPSMVVGGILAVPVSFVIGLVCFRLRGPYFILALLALAEVLREIALYWRDLTAGPTGIQVPALFGGLNKTPYYLLALALAALTLLASYLVVRSKWGYYLMAIRDDQETAESVGINSTKYKLIAFAISAFFTGLAGAFYARYITFIDPDTVLSVGRSVEIMIFPIIGGTSTFLGPLVGAIVLGPAIEYLRSTFKEAYILVYGLILVIVTLFVPGGIVGQGKRLGQTLARRMGRQRDAAIKEDTTWPSQT